jgi:hypothetical protein
MKARPPVIGCGNARAGLAVAGAAVQTMRALGVTPHFLATSLLGIVAQRLVRTLCPECKAPFPLGDAPATFAEVRPWLEPGQGLALYSAHGCPASRMTSYAGRKGVFEVLRVSPALRTRIAEGRPTRALREQAVREGLIELRKAALLEVARGGASAALTNSVATGKAGALCGGVGGVGGSAALAAPAVRSAPARRPPESSNRGSVLMAEPPRGVRDRRKEREPRRCKNAKAVPRRGPRGPGWREVRAPGRAGPVPGVATRRPGLPPAECVSCVSGHSAWAY